jgi:hypothetical protein
LLASIGSFGSTAASATRLPPGQNLIGLGERARRQRRFRPRHLAQMLARHFVAEAQRLRRNHDGARGDRLLVGLEALHALFGGAVEPGLRDEDRQEAEHDGEGDHDDGAFTHAVSPD